MMLHVTALTFLLLLSAEWCQAQALGGDIFVDTLRADAVQPWVLRPFIVPGSVTLLVDSLAIDSSAFRVDERHGRIWYRDARPGMHLVVRYRALPLMLQSVYRRNEGTPLVPDETSGRAGPITRLQDRDPSVNLERSGSLSRGVVTGSNRDLSVESGLRLNVAGNIAKDVRIRAELTDESTPIQPEGNTRRISEFDRMLVELQAPRILARLGDFDVSFEGTEFARFHRKLQGGSASYAIAKEATRGFRVTGAGAVSRGLFQSQPITAVEGVQGPYRLQGREGEQFIVVLAGTESVYLDGSLLVRGETDDYVVDYQTGEITFTPRVLITAESRILAEFQYTTSEYTRALVGSQVDAWLGGAGSPRYLRLGMTFLRESDSRRFNAQLGLTSSDSALLVASGDLPAVRSGAEPVLFDPEAPFVQYILRDTVLTSGATDSVYVPLDRQPLEGERVYRVRFSHVGPGDGRYERSGRSVNGIQYRYVGPGNGAYEPVRVIPAPRLHQVAAFTATAGLMPGLTAFGEWSQSVLDVNRLSSLDEQDNMGNAWTAGARWAPSQVLVAEVRRRFIAARFQPMERIRDVEFERRWNLARDATSIGVLGAGMADETIDEINLVARPTAATSAAAEAARIQLAHLFSAERLGAHIRSGEPGFPGVSYDFDLVQSDAFLLHESGRWVRGDGRIDYSLGRLTPFFETTHEDRRQEQASIPGLQAGSFRFVELRPGIAWTGERLTARASVEVRDEGIARLGVLQDPGRAWTLRSRFEYDGGPGFGTDGTIGVRKREKGAVPLETAGHSESVVLQWNGRLNRLNRAVETSWFYEAQTERTPVLQEVYVRTGPEYAEAQFSWEDANGNGIVELDEFVPERTPLEGAYAQVYVPSDSLASTIGLQTRLRVSLDPSRYWTSESGLRKLLTFLSARTTVDIVERSREPDLARIYLLDLSSFRRPGRTLNGRLRVAQEVFLFKNSPRFGLDFTASENRSFSELTGGAESRLFATLRVDGRLLLSPQWSMTARLYREHNRLSSEQFSSRRYDLRSIGGGQESIWTLSRRFQVIAAPRIAIRRDAVGLRRATQGAFALENRYTNAERLTLTGRLEPSWTSVTGQATGLALYELTEGRGEGFSLIWTVAGTWMLNDNLRATLTYDGRDARGIAPVHTLRLQMTAFF